MASGNRTSAPPSTTAATPIPRLLIISWYAFTLALGLVVYRGIAAGYFYNDDFLWMNAARHDMNAGNVLSFRVIGFFRPMINMVFYATERIAPGDITIYSYTNLLLHYLNAMFLCHLLQRVCRSPLVAAGTALLFLVTGVHASAVLWISARTTLISSGFLLLSLLVVVRHRATARRLVASLTLYAFALLAKETAIIGLLILALLRVVFGRRENSVGTRIIIGFAAVTLAYLALRYLVIGGMTQDNWGPGWHVLKNIAGGVLYQFYPWAPAAILGIGMPAPESTHTIWPEIMALPILAVLILLGWRLAKLREMAFALGWTLIGLLPASFFTFRFFATTMLTQDRYYYLSSAGTCLAVVLLLWAMWTSRRMRSFWRTAAMLIFGLILAGETYHVHRRTNQWRAVTNNNRAILGLVEKRLDYFGDFSTCVIENPPMRYPYLKAMLRLERPNWTIEKAASGDDALRYRPCLHLRFVVDGNNVSTVPQPLR